MGVVMYAPAPPPQGIPLRSLRSASPFDSRKGTFTLTLALSDRGRGDNMLLRSSQGVQGYGLGVHVDSEGDVVFITLEHAVKVLVHTFASTSLATSSKPMIIACALGYRQLSVTLLARM